MSTEIDEGNPGRGIFTIISEQVSVQVDTRRYGC